MKSQTRRMIWDVTLVSCAGNEIELLSGEEVSWNDFGSAWYELLVDGVSLEDVSDHSLTRIIERSEAA